MHASGLNNCFKLETTDVSCTTNHQLAMLMRKAGNDCRRKWNQQGQKRKTTAVLCFSHQLLKLNRVTQAFFILRDGVLIIIIKKY